MSEPRSVNTRKSKVSRITREFAQAAAEANQQPLTSTSSHLLRGMSQDEEVDLSAGTAAEHYGFEPFSTNAAWQSFPSLPKGDP